MTTPTQAGWEPQPGAAHSQGTPRLTLGATWRRRNVVERTKCSRERPTPSFVTRMSSKTALATAVPTHTPSHAQSWTLTRRTTAVFPIQTHASAVPLEDLGGDHPTSLARTSRDSGGRHSGRFPPMLST